MALYITSKILSMFIISKVSTVYSIAILHKNFKRVISNVFDYISKVIVIVIITFLQVL